MDNNRSIIISVGNSRRDLVWKQTALTVEELYTRLSTPVRGMETVQEYLHLKKAQQDDLKDVGGFVGGPLKALRRKAANVIGRDLITLDFDNVPGWRTDDLIAQVDKLGCSYCVYSTRKHAPSAPRLRVVIPFDRTVTPDEYEPCARRVADLIGIGMADPTTFEACRLMYWPSCCADSEYVFRTKDAPLISADELLSSYADWHDYLSWPQVPGAAETVKKLAVKADDPLAKNGIVGAFCRTYDVVAAMDAFLPGVYSPVDTDPDRYTYLGGSTTGGAIVYDGGKFLFSHHATDPTSGRLVNAFDLIRLHKFGDKDDSANPDTPSTKLPSFRAMSELALADPATLATLSREQHEAAMKDFADLVGDGTGTGSGGTAAADSANADWTERLRHTQDGGVRSTIDNALIILDNDPLLKDRFALNKFTGRGEILGPLPWDKSGKRRSWADSDNAGLYWYMERYWGLTGNGKIDNALSIHSNMYAFNDVQDFIAGLEWDGVPRLDTLFVDYLGAQDTAYGRAVCRKAFTAAVARAMEPGCKHDVMLILSGPQGIGKSTLLDKMSRGWFNDSIRTFEGKEAAELIQGAWLVEIAELEAFSKSDIARIKQFLSLRVDRYRAAYGRHAAEFPRHCVFFGTTNSAEYLQDPTGNRRFWPVDVGLYRPAKSVFTDLTEEVIRQLWAEAKTRWACGEPLHLLGELDAAAKEQQDLHREVNAKEGLIAEFVNREVPEDWASWPIDRRRDFWNGATPGSTSTKKRDRVCAAEVWCELFNRAPGDLKKTDTREINAILLHLPGWKPASKVSRFGPYGAQRGYTFEG